MDNPEQLYGQAYRDWLEGQRRTAEPRQKREPKPKPTLSPRPKVKAERKGVRRQTSGHGGSMRHDQHDGTPRNLFGGVRSVVSGGGVESNRRRH